MSSVEYTIAGKRGAIIIGINEYEDDRIPKLKGAVNDAKDMAYILQKYGHFEIEEGYNLLTDNQATLKNIRTNTISDILYREDDPFDLNSTSTSLDMGLLINTIMVL